MGCSSEDGETKYSFEVELKEPKYVCVSPAGGTNRPYVELKITLSTNEGSLTKRLYLKSAGSGEVEFDPGDSPEVTTGTPTIVKLYGKAASAAVDGTKVECRLGPDADVCDEVELTVFEGVIINFSGTFFSPISNYGGNPPGPGVGPAACENPPTPANNRIFFTKSQIQRYTTADPEVVVDSVFAKTPSFELTADSLKGAKLRLLNTIFLETDGTGNDTVQGWNHLTIPQYLTGQTSTNTKIATTINDPTPQQVTAWINYVNGLFVGPLNACFLDLKDRMTTEQGAELCASTKYAGTFATWTNSTLQMSLGTVGNDSMAARAFVIKQGNGNSTVSCTWQDWDWATLNGVVKDGKFETQ